MRNISSVLVIDKNKIASDRAWLVAMQIDVVSPASGLVVDTIRVVRNDENITIEGEVFEPFPFDIELEDSEGIPTVRVTIQDQTRGVQSRMEEYAGGVGSKVQLFVVSGDAAASLSAEPDLTETFEVKSASCSDYVVNWELGVRNPLNQTFPRRTQYTDQCSFRYKSAECGYAGHLATCDHTLGGANGCRAHDNAERFGGVPGVKGRY